MDRWEYNSRDVLATRCIFDALHPLLNPNQARVYHANLGVQGAFLGVQMRGIKVDLEARADLDRQLKAEMATKVKEVEAAVGHALNCNSPKQVQKFFYEELGLAKQYNGDSVTADEDALKRIAKRAVTVVTKDLPRAEVTRRKDLGATVANLMLEERDLAKQRSSISLTLLEHGRMRTTLKIGGTESYRAASSKSHSGKGVNLQNVDKRLRKIYIPDFGQLGQMDQERAESLTVAYSSGDEAYIDAHLRGNTHVTVARILWPNMEWNGDEKHDKDFAKIHTVDGKPPHGRNDLYSLAKSIQHGLNYLLTARGVSHHTGLQVAVAEKAYESYFTAFPGIGRWHQEVIAQVRDTGIIVCPGYERIFFGRRKDPATWREAISFIPQSIVAWTNHIVFARLYYELDEPGRFEVLNHGHDAVVFQVQPDLWPALKPRIIDLARVEWPIRGRTMVIPFEIKLGANWAAV